MCYIIANQVEKYHTHTTIGHITASTMNSLLVNSESMLSPPFKKMRLQNNFATNRSYNCYVKEQWSSTVKKIHIQNEEHTLIQQSNNYVQRSDGNNSFLWNWQKRQQNEQVVKLISYFKTINTFAGKGVATRRQGKLAKTYHRDMIYSGGFPCPICDKTYQNTDDRLVHFLTQACTRGYSHLLQINSIWYCLTCDDEEFFNKEEAESHARGHMLGKGMLCPVCSQDFQDEKANDLFRHVKKQHREYIHNLC